MRTPLVAAVAAVAWIVIGLTTGDGWASVLSGLGLGVAILLVVTGFGTASAGRSAAGDEDRASDAPDDWLQGR